HGQAQRHPTDSEQLRVGEEIAGARALMDIATQLLQKAHVEIDEVKGKPSRPLI
ncbi:dsRBD fold-containing protein, partial [Streptomyces fradiae]